MQEIKNDSKVSINSNQPISLQGFSPQITGPVYFSFPPPCVPSPLDTRNVTHNAPLHVVPETNKNSTLNPSNGEGSTQIQTATEATSDAVVQMSDGLSSCHITDDNRPESTECVSRPLSVENAQVLDYPVAPPYSVLLPPGSFVHHIGGGIQPQLYHQFSPVLPGPMSQFHPVYPVNMIPAKDLPQSNPSFVPVRQSMPPESSCEQNIPNQQHPSTSNVTVCASQIPENTWPSHPNVMPPNPPVYWGHYMTSGDKTHGIALASQTFMRQQSICDEAAVVTPTNICPPSCNFAGIVSATPEFIHPRKPDVPQWLMSPPVGDQDPSIISYAPMMYHNMRVPSVTGIAIPVVGPIGTTLPVGGGVAEPPKIDSPALVVSPVPCFENMQQTQLPNCVQIQENTANVDVFYDSVMQRKDFPQPPYPVQFEQHHIDYISSDLQEILTTCTTTKETRVSQKLLTPAYFDSGYDSSNDDIETNYPDRNSKTRSEKIVSDNLSDIETKNMTKEMLNFKIVSPDSIIIANLKNAAKRFPPTEINDPKQDHCREKSRKQTDLLSESNEVAERKCSTVSKSLKCSSQTTKSCRSIRHRNCCSKELYSNLLSAAFNLSAAYRLFLHKSTCGHTKKFCCHKKKGFAHNSLGCVKGAFLCSLKHSIGPPLFKRVAELQQQTQCWQCVTEEKNPDIKHPAPDLFNQWPNIPPPPAPVAEDEDCQSVCSGAQIAVDALPLAAALFHSEPNECCQGNGAHNQDEDQVVPTYPIGVFWDIENCAVPTGKSALGIVQRVRERFFAGHKEAEFMCVCDINKESRHIIQDLNNAQVNVVHINATAKNAADDKLRQSIRRFAHSHPAPATVVLITGDSNFTSEVSDLRHRHKYFVVLIHPANASPSLLQAATTVICYEQLIADLPIVHISPKTSQDSPQPQLLVANLPLNNDANAVRARLRQISDNCGGKVVKLSMGTAILKFATADAANRALKRLDGEDVFGHSINVSILQSPNKVNYNRNGKNFQTNLSFSPGRNYNCYQINKQQNYCDKMPMQDQSEFPAPPNLYPQRATMNLTPGHCDPRTNFRPNFQPLQFSMATQFSGPSVMNLQPHPPYNHNNPSPQHCYNSMPPPPQPQLFQPPLQNRNNNEFQDTGVILTISNIDAQLGINAIQDILLKQISDHCQILDMKVRPHNRFTVVCDITVPHVRDASRVLQHLQRQKIGTKRVLVTLAQQNVDEFGIEEVACLKRDCYAILKETAGKKMPLYRFFNMYEKRFQQKVRLEELRQISDVVLFQDGSAGKEIYLNPKIENEQSLEQHLSSYTHSGRSTPADINHDFLLPVCKLHYPADAPRPPSGEKGDGLLKIEMGLREFSAKLHALLHSHNGILQLDGFEYCYRAEYGSFPFPSDSEEGVIVEHQASYVPGVQIITSQPHCLGVKAIVWAQPQSDTGSDTASDTSGASRWKSPNLIHFSREVVELLKEKQCCCLPYDSFNTAYQRHFGHACRVSEYGFTRLSDLLAAIPHVLQVMGSLSNRILTLTHRAQVKRFTQEVVKILKSTPDRAILVAQMPELYNRTFKRAWRLRDYGVSVLSDLLDDIPEGHICTTGEGDNIVLSLPVRERTHEEKERTIQFAREVVKILRSRPHYSMPFTDFVPTYHRQFGRQCKLANYGFSKLIDLFEALPHVVQVVEKGAEKLLSLTDAEQQKILSIQITSILRAQIPPSIPLMSAQAIEVIQKNNAEGPTLPLACVPALFQQKYGFPLIPQEFNASDLDDLMKKLSHAIKVVINKTGDKMVRLAERKPLRLLSAQLLALLLDQTSDQLDIEYLHSMYTERYKENVEPSEYGFLTFCDIMRKALPGVVKMDLDAQECLIHIKPLYKEARAIRSVLLKNNGTMTIGEFNFSYLTTFQRTVDYERLGFSTFESLLRALPNVLIVKGFGAKRTLTLRNHMQCGPLTVTSVSDKTDINSGISSSASMNDLQTCDAAGSSKTSSIPSYAMTSNWSGQQLKNSICNSASTGDFKSEDEKRREEKMSQSRTPNWIPSTRPLVPSYSAPYNFHFSKPRFSHPLNNASKTRQFHPKSPLAATSACNFTVGEESTSNSATSASQRQQTPNRRSISVNVITLPNGSTPIASTSSCSSNSTPKSIRSSRSSEYSDDSCSSDENCVADSVILKNEFSSMNSNGVSSLPNSPFTTIRAAAFVGPLPSIRNGHHPGSEHGSPGRIQLAASFPTLTQT